MSPQAIFGEGHSALNVVSVAWLGVTFFCGWVVLVLQAMGVVFVALSPRCLDAYRRKLGRRTRSAMRHER